MTITFDSAEANEILARDKLAEKVRAKGGQRLEEIERDLETLADEIEYCENELNDLKYRQRDLEAEQRRLKKGEPG